MRFAKDFLHRNSKQMSRQHLYDFLRQELSGAQPGNRVLNVGAGGEVQDLLLDVQGDLKFSMLSIDISAERNPDVVADVRTFADADRFDFVVLVEVLEHVPEPHKAIENINRLLKPGGKLVLTCPFLFPLHDRPHDYFRYTKYGLEFLLRGFDDVEIRERSGWLEALFVIQSRILREPTPFKFLRLAFGSMAIFLYPLAQYVSRLANSDYATTGYLVSCTRSTSLPPA